MSLNSIQGNVPGLSKIEPSSTNWRSDTLHTRRPMLPCRKWPPGSVKWWYWSITIKPSNPLT